MRKSRLGPWMIGMVAITALAPTSPAHATGSGGPLPRGVFPGANGRIAFVIDRGNGGEIDTVEPDGTDLRLLIAATPTPVASPDWSPNGRRIVFVTETAHGCSVKMADAAGGQTVNLTNGRPGCETEPTFTPDGDRIVFAAQRCESCTEWISSMDLKGHHRQKILAAPPRAGVEDISVSPDGTQIAFVAARAQYRRALYTVGTSGANLRKVLPYSLDVGAHFDWAPDGNHIAFTEYSESPPGHQPNVVRIQPNGSHPDILTSITRSGVGDGGATYAPNGRWIVYRYENDNSNKFWLSKMHPNGLDKTRIKRLPFTFMGTAWSPRPHRCRPKTRFAREFRSG